MISDINKISPLPLEINKIIIKYSNFIFCKKCEIFLSRDNLSCGKCNLRYCLECAKNIAINNNFSCNCFPKCICCSCDSVENFLNYSFNNKHYRFSMWYLKRSCF